MMIAIGIHSTGHAAMVDANQQLVTNAFLTLTAKQIPYTKHAAILVAN